MRTKAALLALLGVMLGVREKLRLTGAAPVAAVIVPSEVRSPAAIVTAEAEPIMSPVAPPPERDCATQIRAALSTPPDAAGTPALDAVRTRVLLAAKSEPVYFSRRPAADARATKASRSYRAMLDRTHSPWSMLQRMLPVFAANTELARSVLLREGYLYAEDPTLAFALVDLVSVQLLFNEPRLWIERGERRLTAHRTSRGHYVYGEGPERGQRARLLLFDRIGAGEPPPALHHDFRALRQRLGFDAAVVVHQAGKNLVTNLRYGAHWVQSLLRAEGAHLEMTCEDVGELGSTIREHRKRAAEHVRLLEPLRQAMREQVEEGLPFDEPRTEYGQQDGALRRAWLRAYNEGRFSYELNDDRYPVFNSRGQPAVPQVCIDFIFDTFERAGGSWWNGRDLPRERRRGRLDLASSTSLDLRRAMSMVELPQARPDWFELKTIPETERVPFKNAPQLARYLTQHSADFQPGDIVLIRGYAPWDRPWKPRIMHMHSFFVYENDPLTGMPSVLVGNPGQPVLQTWQFEAFRTPERSIHYRVRPRLEWLRQVVTPAPLLPISAPLSVDAREARLALDIPTPPGADDDVDGAPASAAPSSIAP